MRSAQRSNPRLTVFFTVLSIFLFVAFLVAATITAANYVETRRTAERVAADAFAATIARIAERRDEFFSPVLEMTALLRSEASITQGEEAKEAVLRLALPGLTLNPQISAVYVGYENGNFLQIMSISPAEKPFIFNLGGPAETRFAVEEISSRTDGVRIETWRFLDSDRRQIGTLASRLTTYDPRHRGWYRDAMTDPAQLVRTPAYVFGTTGQVGVTDAQAFAGGVVGVDVTLERLMAFVRSVRPSLEHRVVAFDEEGRLMLHFDSDSMFEPGAEGSLRLATTAEMKDPVVEQAYRIFSQKGPFRLARFAVDGTGYMAAVSRNTTKDGSVFYLLYAAPASDFQGSLGDAAKRSVFVALLIFAVLLPAIAYIARLIARPLRRLSGEAELIKSFQLGDPIDMESPVREVHTLIRSMAGLKSTLREVSKFVPKALVKDILQSENVVTVGGQIRRISILFTDVKDFTPMAQAVPAENLMVNLSAYFEELASVIIAEDGTVDKFIGDAIFAFWNAPLPVARHEHAACLTALKCRAASERLNARWKKDGLSPWHTRFGVHTGDAVLGNVGSSDRIDYTAIGDTVNIASRLEGLNKFYGTGILASGEIAAVCADEFLFRHVGGSLPKGSGELLEVYELLGMREGPDDLRATAAMSMLASDWGSCLEILTAKDWQRALAALESFVREHPGDAVAEMYRGRVTELLRSPASAGWDGIMRFDQK